MADSGHNNKPRQAREILLTDVRISFATLVVLAGILVSILEARYTIKAEMAQIRADLKTQQTIADTHATAADLTALRQVLQLQLVVVEKRLDRVEKIP